MNCIFIGDFGTADEYQEKVANSMKELINKHDIKFICGLGDNIYEHGVKTSNDIKFKTHFEIPYKDINIKFYQTLGNHDYGENYGEDHPYFKYQIDYTNNSDKWYLPDRYYTFSKNFNGVNVDFFVLDTNIDLMNSEEIDEQLNYFIDKISESKADWKILYGHHTYRSTAGHGNAEKDLEDFLNEIFNLGEIDIYMCGHDHTKQYIQKHFYKI